MKKNFISKEMIYKIIEKDVDNYLPSKIFDMFMIFLILLNSLLIILDTFDNLNIKNIAIFKNIEIFSTIVFSIEYILRIWTSDMAYPNLTRTKSRIKYLTSFTSMSDFFAILPFYMPYFVPSSFAVLKMIRLLKIIRILKINRYNNAITDIITVLKNKSFYMLSSIFVFFIMMLISSVLMYTLENKAQPGVFDNAFSGLWWSIATLTNVTYGNMYPITLMGKLLGAVIAMLGIGLVAVPTGIISSGFIEQVEAKKNDDKKYCSYCGKKIE